MSDILLAVLKKKKYAIIALATALIIGALSYYLMVMNVFQKSILIYAQMSGIRFTAISLTLTLAISVLFGLYITLLVFRHDIIKARALGNKAAGFSGVATSLLAAGCPACGVPILGFLGLPLGLLYLPFRGLELKVLSLAFLLLAIYLIDKNIVENFKKECSLDYV